MRRHTLAGACAALLTSIACGGSSGDRPAGQAPVDATAVAGYQALAGQVQSAALSYGATMGGPGMMTLAGCAAAHDTYDAQVRPMVARMVQMSGAMDGFIDAHGGMQGTAAADMSCMASAMMAELDAHRNVACSHPTLGDDQAEASRHVGVMTSDASHVYGRCQTMMEAMGGQAYTWGPAAPGCGAGGGSPTDPVSLGERVFDWGIGADGQAIARTGGSGMMMMGSGCASCHGSDGHGLRTMMFTTPNITYSNLTDPAGMLDPDGSRGPTYTDDLIHRAVVQGIDADGAPLSSGMPRWQMTDQDFGNLLQFLKTLP